jgi:hypothetical protein
MLDYGSLSRHERRAAKKLAKELLRTVPAAQDPGEASSIRGALSTAFMKPENVIGALVYTGGNDNWWGDVVFKKGEKPIQMGTHDVPAQSYDDALRYVKSVIAIVKAMREHPLVQELREIGHDPERVELLRVRHEKFGHRWMFLDGDKIATEAEAFVAYVDDEFPTGVDKLEQARTVVLSVDPNDAQEGALQILHCAAAFLLSRGIANVDHDTNDAGFGLADGETMSQRADFAHWRPTETNFGWPDIETISRRPTLH